MNNGWQQAVFLLSPIVTYYHAPMVSGSAYLGLLKLRHDVAFAASRRNNRCVATQQQIRRDVIPATSCPIK